MERMERERTEQLRSRLERLNARAFLADDSGAYRAGVEDALAELADVLERPVTAAAPTARRRRSADVSGDGEVAEFDDVAT